MTVYFAADHAGFELKRALMAHVRTLGYDVEDLGAYTFNPDDDYPDFVAPLAQKVVDESARGVVIGGSGQGEAMTANRVKGARAAVFYGPARVSTALEIEASPNGSVALGGGKSEDAYDAIHLARRHNDANILSIGARFVSDGEAKEAVRIFLATPFKGGTPEGSRHVRRLAKF